MDVTLMTAGSQEEIDFTARLEYCDRKFRTEERSLCRCYASGET